MRTGATAVPEKTDGTFYFTLERTEGFSCPATLTVTNKKITVAHENTILEKPLNQIQGVRVTRGEGFLGLGFWCNHTLWISGVGQLTSSNYEDITTAANLITSLMSR